MISPPPRLADSLASIDPESVAQSKETIGLELVFKKIQENISSWGGGSLGRAPNHTTRKSASAGGIARIGK